MTQNSAHTGKLYVVGTPIGNLGDLSPRVGEAFAAADAICCEDTRVTSKLLMHLGISKPLVRCDENVIASRAAGLFAGEAKTDERDAAVIARTALGVPDSLSGIPGRGEALEAARALSSQRDHVVACATRDKNRLRAVLLESCPALEAAVDLSDRRWLELLAGFGGAWGIARSGAGGPRAEAAGEAAAASTAPPPALVEAENRQVRFLAARISEALDEAGALEAETAALLEGDETYACLLTVPGIGPRTAAQLAVSVDIGRFPVSANLKLTTFANASRRMR